MLFHVDTNTVPNCLQLGWPTETWKYAMRIRHILFKLADAQMVVRLENLKPVQNYLNAVALSQIQTIIQSILDHLEPQSMELELHDLGDYYRQQRDGKLKKALETTRYNIDLPDSLPLLFGQGRIEKVRIADLVKELKFILGQYLLPLLQLLLSHHLEIIQLAKHVILDDRELYVAEDSLDNVFNKVGQRVSELRGGFSD